MSEYINFIGAVSIAFAVTFAGLILFDIFFVGNRQHMWIMEIVWPVTALYFGPIAVYAYYTIGRKSTHKKMKKAMEAGEEPPSKKKPFWQSVAVSALHCGSGCTIADLIVEWLVVIFPVVIFGHKIFGSWVVDYIAAFIIGIAFQYLVIKPMRGLSASEAVKEAVKADALSLTCWQIGMYGWMAIVTFVIYGHELPKTTFTFWFMMQIAMIFGFFTSFAANWWLVKKGVKEAM